MRRQLNEDQRTEDRDHVRLVHFEKLDATISKLVVVHRNRRWRSSALLSPAVDTEVAVETYPRLAGPGAWEETGIAGDISRRLSSFPGLLHLCSACLVRARQPVLSWARGPVSLGAICALLMQALTQSLNLLRGLPCFHVPEASSPNISCFGSQLSSMQMTFYCSRNYSQTKQEQHDHHHHHYAGLLVVAFTVVPSSFLSSSFHAVLSAVLCTWCSTMFCFPLLLLCIIRGALSWCSIMLSFPLLLLCAIRGALCWCVIMLCFPLLLSCAISGPLYCTTSSCSIHPPDCAVLFIEVYSPACHIPSSCLPTPFS